MKTFIQTLMVPDFVIQSNVLEKRWWPTWPEPYASFFYEWAEKGHYTVEPHPEDYLIQFENGSMALGYYWGDETFVAKCEEYLEAKKSLPAQTYVIKNEVIVCADNQHPVFVQMSSLPVVSYTLASDPTTVILA